MRKETEFRQERPVAYWPGRSFAARQQHVRSLGVNGQGAAIVNRSKMTLNGLSPPSMTQCERSIRPARWLFPAKRDSRNEALSNNGLLARPFFPTETLIHRRARRVFGRCAARFSCEAIFLVHDEERWRLAPSSERRTSTTSGAKINPAGGANAKLWQPLPSPA